MSRSSGHYPRAAQIGIAPVQNMCVRVSSLMLTSLALAAAFVLTPAVVSAAPTNEQSQPSDADTNAVAVPIVSGQGTKYLLYPGTNVVGVQRPLLQPGTPYPATGKTPVTLAPPTADTPASRIVLRPPPTSPPRTPAAKPATKPPVRAATFSRQPPPPTVTRAMPQQSLATARTEPATTQSERRGIPFALAPTSPDIVIGAHGKVVSPPGQHIAPAPAAVEPAAIKSEPRAVPAALASKRQSDKPETAPSIRTSARERAGLSKRSEIVFTAGAVEPAPDSVSHLGKLASELSATLKGTSRVQLEAFGGTPGDKSSDARRLSLKRALAVRALLIQNGVPAERIDVRALGGVSDGGVPDRVDVFVRTG